MRLCCVANAAERNASSAQPLFADALKPCVDEGLSAVLKPCRQALAKTMGTQARVAQRDVVDICKDFSPLAGGTGDGTMWHNGLKQPATFKQLYSHAEETLLKANGNKIKSDLKKLIFSGLNKSMLKSIFST